MAAFRRKLAENKLGVIFSLLVFIYCLILLSGMPGHRFQSIVFPLIFTIVTSLAALVKLVQNITGWVVLQRVDAISLLKMGESKSSKDPVRDKIRIRREIAAILSAVVFFFMIYLAGFLPGVSIFSFIFTWLSLGKPKLAIVVCALLTGMTWLGSVVLQGGLWNGILWG